MIKSKPCSVEDCENPRFAKEYCKRHQSLRTDKKPKGLKKISEKGKVKKELKKQLLPTDMAFYFSVWEQRSHTCEECGCRLGDRPLLFMFDHILEKSKYPELRHEPRNIQLLCLVCHSNKTNGMHSDRMKEKITLTKIDFKIQ